MKKINTVKARFLVYFLVFLTLQTYVLHLSHSSLSLISVSAGKVEKKIITSRETHINYIIEHVLFKRKKVPSPLKVKDKNFLLQVDSLLLEEALYLESKNFFKQEISSQEINETLETLKNNLKDHPYWKKQNVLEPELKSILERKLSVKKFMKSRIEASVTLITNEEAKDYYNRNKKKFGQTSFKKISKNIKNYLSQKFLNQRLNEWFRILQKKYNVQNFLHEI